MTEKVKPCPFCGSKAEIQGNRDGNVFQVACPKCGARNLWSFVARERWNKRTRKDTSLKPCPICGKKGRVFETYKSTFCVQCSECGLTTPDFGTPDDAKTAWNRRPGSND